MTSTMSVPEYTKEFLNMTTRLHPTDSEEQKVYHYITGLSQTKLMQELLYMWILLCIYNQIKLQISVFH